MKEIQLTKGYAGGCHAIAWWSWTDADRLCPVQHKTFEPPEMPFDKEWIIQGKQAIELIQKGIDLFEKIKNRGSSNEWKEDSQ